MIDRHDARRQFHTFLQQNDLVLPQGKALNDDGHFHRCHVASKGRRGYNDGSYVLHVYDKHAVGVCAQLDERGRGAEVDLQQT